MADVVVRPVQSWLDKRRFVDLPWTLYRDDPNWMPPLRGNLREMAGLKHHPFQDHGEMQAFLAWRNGQPVGRIVAIVNREHLRVYQDGRGFFGFFESVDDPAVSRALFDAARGWLAERGFRSIRGPANPSMNYECGLLVDGFDRPPVFMMTYNPPYYPALVEDYGFRKTHDLLAYYGHVKDLPDVDARIAPLAEQAQAFCQATIRPLNPKRFRQDVDQFVDLYNRALTDMWGFVPLPESEVRKLAGSLQHLLVPEMTIFAEVKGQAVGVIVGLPDYNPRIKHINGRLFPFGVFHLLSKKREIKRIRVLSINVVPEFQRWGLGLVLMRSLIPKAMDLNIQEAEFSWVSETNRLARQGLEKAKAEIYKTYRMYDYDPPAVGS